MVELDRETLEQILEKETPKSADLKTILRSIYTRYMRLYEKYFADIDALTYEEVAELRKYHEETESLVKYYYLDIPQDICSGIQEFDEKFSAVLLGPEWHKNLYESYDEFREKNTSGNQDEKYLKAEFSKQALASFYEAIGYVFREGFGTDSKATENLVNGIKGLLFGKE